MHGKKFGGKSTGNKIQKKIVKRYGKYRSKSSRIVIRYEEYGRKES
jgi:hypothetical protein